MEKTASTPIQLFRGMTADELAALRAAHCIRVQRYDKNALICHAGRVVHEIGIVQSGSVNVESNDLWGNKSILSHVEAGQAFAETYALRGEPLMVDVAAAEPCEILWLDLVPMLQQQNTAASWYPKFLHNLLLLSMQKNLALSQRIRCTTPKSARGRLLTYLSAQAVRAGSTHFSIPFDRQQLADYLNLDRSALSKELGKMRDDGLIRCRKNNLSCVERNNAPLSPILKATPHNSRLAACFVQLVGFQQADHFGDIGLDGAPPAGSATFCSPDTGWLRP